MRIYIRKRKFILTTTFIIIFSVILIVFLKPWIINAACYTRSDCTNCKYGDNGCLWSSFSNSYACNCNGATLYCDKGDCVTCDPPSCPIGYSTSYTSCTKIQTSCTKYNCIGSCGTNYRDCYPYQYTLTYTAGSNGSIVGTTPQTVCRGSSGSSVTADPNPGYHFVQWSDSSTSNPRTDTNVTANVSVTASFAISNQAPTAPTSLLTEGVTNPSDVTNITPEFSAIYNDPDTGDTALYYEIEVNTNNTFTGTVMWDSGKTSMSSRTEGQRSQDITYNGTTLTYDGSTYYWRIRFWDDDDAQGDWSATGASAASFTMDIPTAEYYQIQVNTNNTFTGTTMWDSGKTAMTSTTAGQTSPTLTYAGSTLSQGVTYYWRIKFWDMNDNASDWSSTATFKLDQTPTAPTDLHTETTTNPTKVIDTTPEFSAIFDDPDTSDQANYYEIEVNTQSDFAGTVMWDSGKTSMTATNENSRSPEISYAGSSLTAGQTYYWRIKFWDVPGLESPWSSTASFIMSGPPIASDLKIADQTNPILIPHDLYFSAIYTDPNDDNSSAYEIEVNTNLTFTGTVMWDSNKTSTTITSGNRSSDITYNGAPLSYDGTTYYIRMRFWDIDDNVGDWVTGQFTDDETSFRFNDLQMNGIKIN